MLNTFDRFDNAMRSIEMRELYWNQSPPTRFRTKYFDEVTAYDSVDVLMNHSLIDIITDPDGTMTAGVFTTLDRENTYEIQAKRFVLACGAVENAKLLLYFNAKNGTNYGNVSGMLGKFFMEHPELDAAQFVMMDPDYQHRVHNHAFRFYRPTREWQLRDHIPSAILRIYFTHKDEQDQIVSELEAVSNLKREEHWRAGFIMMSFEQMPVTSNSVVLSDELDVLGMPHAILNWRLLGDDYRAPRLMVNRFANMMVNQGFGRVRFFDWIMDESIRADPLWAKHHIGTTRMATNELQGCVDTDGCLFGTKNLHVMGSSLFPTAGYENPTLPVVQLALRASDFLLTTIYD